jgi:hypothetical protein
LFGLNIAFGVFRARRAAATAPAEGPGGRAGERGATGGTGGPGGMAPGAMEPSKVEELIPLLPYVHCCHAKFVEMNDNCEETSIPYPEIVKTLVGRLSRRCDGG